MKIDKEYLIKQLGLVIILALMIDFVIGFFVIKPQLDGIKISKIAKTVSDSQTKINSDKAAAIKDLDQRITNYQDSVSKFEKVLPVSSDVPGLLATIEDVAARNGVFITNISPQSKAEAVIPGGGAASKKTYQTDSYSMTMVGDFNSNTDQGLSNININAMGFLDALEKSARPIVVKDIKISGGNGQSKGKIMPVTITMDFETYYLPRATNSQQ